MGARWRGLSGVSRGQPAQLAHVACRPTTFAVNEFFSKAISSHMAKRRVLIAQGPTQLIAALTVWATRR